MRREDLRPALYHRWHYLMPVVSHPGVRLLGRVAVRGLVVLYFGFVLLVLTLRYLVLPNIESYRPEIERHVSQTLGLTVAIGKIEASWQGINPDLILSDVRIADRQGQPALAFTRVESVLSWSSLPRLQIRLRLLRIDSPTLHLRRDADGQFYVAGIAVMQEGGDSGVADWVLAQKRIRINGATVVWDDARRKAPALILEDLNFALDNDGRQHRFGLTALPPAELASRIDLRGDLQGKNVAHTASWHGRIFAQIDYADLAVWSTWLDYPIAIPHGRGAVRAWAGFADGGLSELTADLSLDDVNLRLAKHLPALELEHLSGRVGARFSQGRVSVDGQRVELLTRRLRGESDAPLENIHIEPTDFRVDWQRSAEGSSVRGSLTASTLELAALAGLAAYLPLDTGSRQLLNDYAPRGRVSELRASFQGNAEGLQSYALKSRFHDLALKPRDHLPGISGFSGALDANEQGGAVQLRSQKVRIELPDILPESEIALETLTAQAKWKIGKGRLDAELSRAEFSGPDAAGSAQGAYHRNGEGPGNIDLTATLTHTDARAVWRYLPAAINADARHWVRDALKSGAASEVRLTLKGDLAKFPFVDRKQGQFLVTVKAHDVTLDYGVGWPVITGIDADLRFEGAGMVVHARRGSILGARLSQTRAEIADFDAPVSTLSVKGRAEGDTSEFLTFIKRSPVASQIDHFTDQMSASGKGRLDIALLIPLAETRLGESKVEGAYTFLANELNVDPALPPLRQLSGSLQFSEKDLRIPEINATFFGGPLKIRGGVQGGKVLVIANGTVGMDELRRRVEFPLLDKVSGSTAYRAEVAVRKGNVELVLDSNLVGVASALAVPFGKNASETMPLHFENTALPTAPPRTGQPVLRDQLRATLGNILSVQLIRRKEGEDSVPERGTVMVGRPLPQLPERGISIGISGKNIDLDYWQRMLRSGGKEGAPGASPGVPVSVDLKADEAVLLGRYYTDVSVGVTGTTPLWRGTVQSREAVGGFQWDAAGAGKLTARFKKWRRPDKSNSDAEPGEILKELPALDIVVDDFTVGARRFGRLDVQAHNEGGVWRLDRIELLNPYGSLSGSGQWQISNANRTQLDFTLDSSDVGKLLDRLGYGGAVRGGSATLKGKIGWNGPPTELDYATLSGEMKLDASKGQFVKLDPGAGKLLGLISLQGLPRRFSLDFGDVFSEGFGFDAIHGRMTVKSGLMHTDRLQIEGPAARVVMRGEADLKHETQNLYVTVQPELGGSAALGIAVVNPLAGVATLLAHKLLQNPLNKVFSFEYLVTGKWDDPKVEKIARSATSGSAPPELPNPSNATGASNESAQQ
jgi:uncharacterized protein (TIGR02099 family)